MDTIAAAQAIVEIATAKMSLAVREVGRQTGACGDYLLRLPGESEYQSMAASHHPVPVQSEFIVRTGGGGWGDPLSGTRRRCAPT